MRKKQIKIIGGLTCLSKTEFGIQLAKEYHAIAINCDPYQSYHELSVGVNKHSVISKYYDGNVYLNYFNNYSVYEYIKDLWKLIDTRYHQHETIVLIANNPFYLYSILFADGFNLNLLRNLEFERQFMQFSNHQLHQKLKILDYKAANFIHENNRRRVLKALYYNHLYKCPYPFRLPLVENSELNITFYFFNYLSKIYYKSLLHERVKKMILDDGWINEVNTFIKKYHIQKEDFEKYLILKATGYLEIYNYLFQQKKDLLKLIQQIYQAHWRLACRQNTFFNKFMNFKNLCFVNENINWMKLIDYDKYRFKYN